MRAMNIFFGKKKKQPKALKANDKVAAKLAFWESDQLAFKRKLFLGA